MHILVTDLEREPLQYDLTFAPREIDFSGDATQVGPLAAAGLAELLEEHRGPKEVVQDVRVRGSYGGQFEVLCARCLDPVEHRLAGEYDLLFRPTGADSEEREHSIGTSETEIGYYQGGGLLLEDVLREQVLLSLPARTLCREDCKGLCPSCGANENTDPCACDAVPADPRWSALSELSSRIKL